MPKSDYEIAKQIICDSKKGIPILQKNFETINEIVNLDSNPGSYLWTNAINQKSSLVCCAILESPFAATIYKRLALSHIIKHVSNPSEQFLVPFIFLCDNTILSKLDTSVTKDITVNVCWSDFTKQLNDYIYENPETTKFAFSQTDIEEKLLYKLLYTNPTTLLPKEVNDYDSYKLIEYCDEKILRNMISDLNSFHENVATAVVNNKCLSNKLKEQAFFSGIDVSELKSTLSHSQMKDIYESVICAAMASETDTEIADRGRSCISKLIEYNLLPESCEIDLIDRIISHDIFLSLDTINKFVKNTSNNIVIEKSLKCNDIDIITSALKNSLSSYSQVIEVFKNYIEGKPPFNAIPSDLSKFHFFKSCLKVTLPSAFYDKILEAFERSHIRLRHRLMTEIAKHHSTPNDVLDKLVTKISPHTITVLEPLTFFNKNTKHLSSKAADEFLNTINAIIHNSLSPDNPDLYSPDAFYFPHLDTPIGEELEDLLNDTINTHPSSFVKTCAEKYLNILYEQDDIYQAKKHLETLDFQTASVDVLKTTQKIIQDQIYNYYNNNDIYSKYLAYKKLSQYVDIYRIVDETLQKKITQEKDLSSKSNKENFNGYR